MSNETFPNSGSHEQPDDKPHSKLCHCPICGGNDMAIKDKLEIAGSKHLHLNLACPDCDTVRETIASLDDVETFEASQFSGELALHSSLAPLQATEIERFTEALHAGHILPEDF